ncbi:MAG: D-alanine--D-alanine ligase [Elusimicrobiota bacterium]
MKKIRLAIIFGGQSQEHEVSLESAKSVYANCLKSEKILPLLLYIDRKGNWNLVDGSFFSVRGRGLPVSMDFSKGFISSGKKLSVDAAFSLIHGNTGEDGKLQGLLEMLKLPYAGCGVLSSAVSMDKKLTKTLAAIAGVPVLPDMIITSSGLKNFSAIKKEAKKLGYPIFVKPNTLGSSVGVKKVKSEKELLPALKYALKYDREVLIEKGVDRAREIVCGLLGGYENYAASPCGEVRVKGAHEFYDYSAKYLDDNGMELLIPAPLKSSVEKKIRDCAVKVFSAIKGYGLARADFFVDPKKPEKFYFCEINVIPGFTSHSLYPRLWEKGGINTVALIEKIVSLALKK